MINLYGADAVRLFILSDSPPEKDVQWSDTGMLASYKFIQKLFLLNEKIKSIICKEKTKVSEEVAKFINQYLKNSKEIYLIFIIMLLLQIFMKHIVFFRNSQKKENFSNLFDDYSKFLISITPVIPHLSNECLEQLKINNFSWPSIDEKFLNEEKINIVVQINGKKRVINTEKDISEENLIKELLSSKTFDKFLKDNKIKNNFM